MNTGQNGLLIQVAINTGFTEVAKLEIWAPAGATISQHTVILFLLFLCCLRMCRYSASLSPSPSSLVIMSGVPSSDTPPAPISCNILGREGGREGEEGEEREGECYATCKTVRQVNKRKTDKTSTCIHTYMQMQCKSCCH